MPDALKPCPFCGHVGLDFDWGSTHRWIEASCGGCGATTGDQRIQTSGLGTHDEWLAAAKRDAITAWNRRALPAPAGEPEIPESTTWLVERVGQDAYTADQLRAYGDARAEHARRVAPGYVLMPEEMTEAMEDAAHEAAYIWRHTEWRAAERARYAAIRAAAPPQGELR